MEEQPGYVDGKHYSEWPDEVRALKREGKLADAEQFLLRLVEATEAEARAKGIGVAPWYYEQLAIIYAKQRDPTRELAILERYESQPHAPGALPRKLADRLTKLRTHMQGGA